MRLPMALAGVGVVLVVAWLHTWLFGPKIGFLSGLVLATSVFMLGAARQVVAEMILELIVVSAVAVFVRLNFSKAQDEEPGSPPLLTPDAASSSNVRPPSFRRRPVSVLGLDRPDEPGQGSIVWGLPGAVHLRRGNVRFQAAARQPVVVAAGHGDGHCHRRGLAGNSLSGDIRRPGRSGKNICSDDFSGSGAEIYERPFWYYLPCPIWQWLPWTPAIIVGAAPSLRAAWQQPHSPHRFVWWWFLGQTALLSCSAGKNHLYLIYALPALAPVAAIGLLKLAEQVAAGASSLRWIARSAYLTPLAGAATVVSIVFFARNYVVDAVMMSLVINAWAIAGGILLKRRRALGRADHA